MARGARYWFTASTCAVPTAGKRWDYTTDAASALAGVTNFAQYQSGTAFALAAVANEGIWRTTDGGATWTAANTAATDVHRFWVAGTTIYTCPVCATSPVMVSTDGGATFASLGAGAAAGSADQQCYDLFQVLSGSTLYLQWGAIHTMSQWSAAASAWQDCSAGTALGTPIGGDVTSASTYWFATHELVYRWTPGSTYVQVAALYTLAGVASSANKTNHTLWVASSTTQFVGFGGQFVAMSDPATYLMHTTDGWATAASAWTGNVRVPLARHWGDYGFLWGLGTDSALSSSDPAVFHLAPTGRALAYAQAAPGSGQVVAFDTLLTNGTTRYAWGAATAARLHSARVTNATDGTGEYTLTAVVHPDDVATYWNGRQFVAVYDSASALAFAGYCKAVPEWVGEWPVATCWGVASRDLQTNVAAALGTSATVDDAVATLLATAPNLHDAGGVASATAGLSGNLQRGTRAAHLTTLAALTARQWYVSPVGALHVDAGTAATGVTLSATAGNIGTPRVNPVGEAVNRVTVYWQGPPATAEDTQAIIEAGEVVDLAVPFYECTSSAAASALASAVLARFAAGYTTYTVPVKDTGWLQAGKTVDFTFAPRSWGSAPYLLTQYSYEVVSNQGEATLASGIVTHPDQTTVDDLGQFWEPNDTTGTRGLRLLLAGNYATFRDAALWDYTLNASSAWTALACTAVATGATLVVLEAAFLGAAGAYLNFRASSGTNEVTGLVGNGVSYNKQLLLLPLDSAAQVEYYKSAGTALGYAHVQGWF